MRKRLLNAIIKLPLLLWLVILFIFISSHSTQRLFTSASRSHLLRIHLKENGVVFSEIHGWPTDDGLAFRHAAIGAPGFGVPVLFDGNTLHSDSLLGISWQSGNAVAAGSFAVKGIVIVVPWLWLLCIATLLCMPACYSLRHVLRSRHRREVGLCVGCGYDLRATPDRCPECGRECGNLQQTSPANRN